MYTVDDIIWIDWTPRTWGHGGTAYTVLDDVRARAGIVRCFHSLALRTHFLATVYVRVTVYSATYSASTVYTADSMYTLLPAGTYTEACVMSTQSRPQPSA